MNDRDPATRAAQPAVSAAAPSLSSILPSSGPMSGNNSVTLNGTGFVGITAVYFGSRPSPGFTANSPTQITASVPAGTGTVPVNVRTPSSTSNSVSYTYAAVPTLTSVSPMQGPASGGTTVTLSGSGFTGATAVNFGSTPAGFTINSTTQITAVTPAGAGAVPVSVTAPGGTTDVVYFFYAAPPMLTSLSPAQGPASGGTTVTLSGTGFTGATAVNFGSTPAGFTVNSTTQITAVSPAGAAGSVPVTVTTAGGVSNPFTFTYAAAPVLATVTPAQGPTSSGSVVTLTGSGLTTTSAVRFGTAPAAFTVESDTSVAAVAPAGSAGTVPVTVTTAGGDSNPLPYLRVAAPAI